MNDLSLIRKAKDDRRLLQLDIYQSKIRYDYLPLNLRVDLKLMLAEIQEPLKEVEQA